jgi:hypothetical protein
MKVHEYIRSLSDDQLIRFHFQVWRRITNGMGYQPYGFDWPTLYAIFPHLTMTLRQIIQERSARKI